MKGDIRYQIRTGGKANDSLTGDVALIEVTESLDDAATFRLQFSIDLCAKKVDGYRLLDDPSLLPGNDNTLSVIVSINGERSVLCHGVITKRNVDLKHGGAGSTLEILGTDRRVVMDRDGSKCAGHTGPVAGIVSGILGTYFTSVDTGRDPTQYRNIQQGKQANQIVSDLAFLKQLAADESASLWIDWILLRDAIIETAHFAKRPVPSGGNKKIPLTMNTGKSAPTLLAFKAERDTEAPKSSGNVSRVDPDTGRVQTTTVPGPDCRVLGKPDIGPATAKARVISAGNVDDANRKTQAALNDAAWTTKASAESTVYALGGIVRPRDVVTVKGVGKQDEGEYFVAKVTHSINPAEHKLAIELKRNALGGK